MRKQSYKILSRSLKCHEWILSLNTEAITNHKPVSLTSKAAHRTPKTTFLPIWKVRYPKGTPLRTKALWYYKIFNHVWPSVMTSVTKMSPPEAKVCGWGAAVCALKFYILLPMSSCTHTLPTCSS